MPTINDQIQALSPEDLKKLNRQVGKLIVKRIIASAVIVIGAVVLVEVVSRKIESVDAA